VRCFDDNQWKDAYGKEITSDKLFDELEKYLMKGGTIYIGTDSQYSAGKCVFASVIGMHIRELKIGNYFFIKKKELNWAYKDLRTKINKEIQMSIDIATYLREKYTSANIEIHADVGTKEKNATNKLVDSIRGWVIGMGYIFKCKPNSWASTSVADWHTK